MDSVWSSLFGPDGAFRQLLLPSFQITDLLDILMVAFLIYEVLIWIRKTRGWTLFRGILIVLVVWVLAIVLNLNIISWLFERLFSIGILALIVIFQPEVRRALERLGTNSLFSRLVGKDNTVNKKTADAIIESMQSMSETRTGALIAVEQSVALGEYEQTGIPIDAQISSQLLINIFVKNTPLHDGAVIIRQNRVLAATCYLPLSEDMSISKELGTRHRAALGLSEVSDAKVFIVSEETGAMSMASAGVLYRGINADFIRKQLMGSTETETEKSSKKHSSLKRISSRSASVTRKESGKETRP